MDRSRVSDPQWSKLGSFQGKIERYSNFLAQAQNHNLGRNVRVLKLLAFLGHLRTAGVKMDGSIDCSAAIRQNYSSPTPMEAAHFLPGQLMIGGQPVWRFATQPQARAQMEFLFAEVEHLPAPFNHADTEAEAKGKANGLCAALSAAATILLRRPLPPSNILKPAYEEWQRLALNALTMAQLAKSAKQGLLPLDGDAFSGYTAESIEARGNAAATEWNREEAARILGYYLADQRRRGWDWVMGSGQGALREVAQCLKSLG